MILQPSVQQAAAATGKAPKASAMMRRHRVAQSRLDIAFKNRRPIVVMVGPDEYELSRIITTFIKSLDKRTTALRLKQPQEHALAAFGEITRAIGFDPKDLTLSDLQKVLALYLEHQCKHRRRTVLCIEQADQQSMWVLDCIARLVDSTDSTKVGHNLTIVLSGATRLTEVLRNPAFDVLRDKAGMPIRLAPFSIFETRGFLRRLSESTGVGDIQGLFEFDAVERLHTISGGVPYMVARLFRECVAILDNNPGRTASSQVVAKAARNLRAAQIHKSGRPVPKRTNSPKRVAATRRLLIKFPKRPPREIILEPGRFMVGRAIFADIQLPSPKVSRRHAMLTVTNDEVQVQDLDSTNGTFAGAERVSDIKLEPETPVKIGDCWIEYMVD